MTHDVAVSKEIAAPAELVWTMVSDLPRMGEWSPESEGGTWIGSATAPTPGAKFRGVNRNGKKHWKSAVTVLDADPGRRFSFRVSALGLKVAEWGYTFEPTSTGCIVTETWTDQRNPIMKSLSGKATGVPDRASHNRAGMEQTLERLAAAAQSGATPS